MRVKLIAALILTAAAAIAQTAVTGNTALTGGAWTDTSTGVTASKAVRALSNNAYKLGATIKTLTGDPDYGGAIFLTNDDGANQRALRIRSTYSGCGASGSNGYANVAIDASSNDQTYGADPSALTFVTLVCIDGHTGAVSIPQLACPAGKTAPVSVDSNGKLIKGTCI